MTRLKLPLIILCTLLTAYIFSPGNRFAKLQEQKQIPSPSPAKFVSQTAVITVSADSVTKTFTVPITATGSALSILQDITRRERISLEMKQYSFGTMVQAISGLANTSDKAWIYYINGQSASVAADSYIVKPGDLIEWKYVTPQL